MKTQPTTGWRRFMLALLAGIASGAGTASAQENEEENQIAVFVELVELEKADAYRLVAEHEADLDGVRLREAIEKRLDDGKATLIESLYTRSREGERALLESVEEFIFGSEGDPPEIASEMRLQKVENLARLRGSPGNFAAFETRNLGPTLEFEVHEKDGAIEIEFSVSVATHLSNHFLNRSPWMRPENEAQHKSLPHFASLKVIDKLRLESGKPVLVRVLQPIRETHEDLAEAKASKRLMVFLTAWVLN